MNNRAFTGMRDSKGKKLFNGDRISFTYDDRHEEYGYGVITGTIVFENAAFVVKEECFTKYDWRSESTRPALLWEWLQNDNCIKRSQKM